MANKDIRRAIVCAGLKYWEIAHSYGCTDGTFSRKLRRELSQEEKARIFAIIDQLKAEKEAIS